MRIDATEAGRRIERLRASLDARAAGWWRVSADRLDLIAFAAAPDLPDEVARGFADATRSVPLSQRDLGIVGAVLDGNVRVSRSAELPAEVGSGHWLRRFAAERSVAVPLRDDQGAVVGVAAVAVRVGPLDDEAIAATVRAAVGGEAGSAWSRRLDETPPRPDNTT